MAAMDREARLARVLRWGLGIYFVAIGIMHFVVPSGLPGPLDWMYDLNDTTHYIAGTAEILGGLGLTLPFATGIQPRLTPLAAAGLTLIMAMAIVWHATRSEWVQIGNNLVIGGVLGYVSVTTWRLVGAESSGRRLEP